MNPNYSETLYFMVLDEEDRKYMEYAETPIGKARIEFERRADDEGLSTEMDGSKYKCQRVEHLWRAWFAHKGLQ